MGKPKNKAKNGQKNERKQWNEIQSINFRFMSDVTWNQAHVLHVYYFINNISSTVFNLLVEKRIFLFLISELKEKNSN